MTDDHYKQEFLSMVEDWTVERINAYIEGLEIRLKVTKEMITELRALKRRKTKYKRVKETGIRSG